MSLSKYHQKYANLPDEEIQKRADVKKDELVSIFKEAQLKTESDEPKIAIVGSGDKRFVNHHKRIFEELLGKPVELTTFDITVEHLEGQENVIQHDCTLPLPNPPYDITYAHVLLKFIETEKQIDLIMNSYYALEKGGLAIHVLDKEDYETKGPKLPDGYYTVQLGRWKKELDDKRIKYQEIPVKYGMALVLLKN